MTKSELITKIKNHKILTAIVVLVLLGMIVGPSKNEKSNIRLENCMKNAVVLAAKTEQVFTLTPAERLAGILFLKEDLKKTTDPLAIAGKTEAIEIISMPTKPSYSDILERLQNVCKWKA